MGLFESRKMLTVNEGINRARTEADSYLIDIRPKDDYKKGHVSGAIHIPMTNLDLIKARPFNAETKLYIIGDYKTNPKKAVKELKKMGYKGALASGNMEEHHGILKKQQ